MKRLFSAALTMLTIAAYGQKPAQIGISGNLVNFTGSASEKGNVNPGFSVMYWKGITKKIDFSVRYNGLFSNYSKNPGLSSSYINELEGSLHARPINDEHLLSPFISAGIGIGNYGQKWAPYAPLGGGLQLNMDGESYIFLQANYRASLNAKNLDNNMFYSLGFTERIGSVRKKVPKPLPPAPVVEIPDRDKDGVPDSADACPDTPGLAQFNGCPDTDGDGIPDKDDKCPNQAGVAKYGGCPVPDTDGDGINDEEDKCPNVAGTAKYNGCPVPDRDGDGVNDEVDKCPDIPGTVANNGCPEVKAEVVKRAEYAAQHLYFLTGSYKLLSKSFKGLNEVAELMKTDAGLKLAVNGYTDNTGNADKNQVLSEKRAVSVRQYLVARGIDESRIQTTGYGQLQPIGDNKTTAGRAKNRRVEFKLNY